MTLHLNKLESQLPQKFFVKFGWNWPCGSGEECFLIPSVHFSSFVIISPLAKCVASFGKKKTLSFSLVAKFSGNWPCGSGEKDENVESLKTDWQAIWTDRGTTGDPKSSPELAAEVSLNSCFTTLTSYV